MIKVTVNLLTGLMNYLQEKKGLGEYASDISDTLLEEDFQGLVIEEDMEQKEEVCPALI